MGNFFWSHTKLSAGLGYGALYNWWAATDGRGIAPTGWHLPSHTEYLTLIATVIGGDTSKEGGERLKAIGLTYWLTNYGTDIYGFDGRGSGQRSTDGSFNGLKTYCDFHVSDVYVNYNNYGLTLYQQDNDWGMQWYGGVDAKKIGMSIRLIKDNSTDPGTVTDYDGNVYPTAKIGDQVWMAQNLKVKHYNNGDLIPLVTDNSAWAALTTGAMCFYDNDELNA